MYSTYIEDWYFGYIKNMKEKSHYYMYLGTILAVLETIQSTLVETNGQWTKGVMCLQGEYVVSRAV